ncbi:flagellar protein FlaG [Paucisalibacillus sp. EB02]|uniref:flagellar protein FlaG n=1 Tax=Paucisalibacillus sp. EB02 TaxID=1347087 RepID=UPI0004B2EA6B|nr:flagellar protein FlaG [Paucisalibacillus sp. EB02]
MRVESITVVSQPLQNSDTSKITSENKSVMQETHNNKQMEDTNGNQIKSAVDHLNDFIEPLRTNLKFEFHEELNEYYVTVVNPNTNEVIKEIPSKKILDMYAAMGEYMGFLIDKKI